MKNSLDLKWFHVRSVLSASLKVKHQYLTPYTKHLFNGCIKTNLLWYKLKKIIKAKIDLPVNMPHGAIFGFLNYKNNSDIINHFILSFKYYLFNSREHKKLSLEVQKNEIVKIYNIEKKKNEKVLEKMQNYRSSATIKHKDFEIGIHIVKI